MAFLVPFQKRAHTLARRMPNAGTMRSNNTSSASSASTTMISQRLVWWRDVDNSNSNSNDDNSNNYWTPALYYASHASGLAACRHGGLAAVTDPVLRRTLTMQLIQEQISGDASAAVPLVRLLRHLDEEAPAKERDSSAWRTLPAASSSSIKDEETYLQRDFCQHMFDVCAQDDNDAAQFHRRQLQYVHALLRQEEEAEKGGIGFEADDMRKPPREEEVASHCQEEEIVVQDDEEEEVISKEPQETEEEEEETTAQVMVRRVSVSVRKPMKHPSSSISVPHSSSSRTPPLPNKPLRGKRSTASVRLSTVVEQPNPKKHKSSSIPTTMMNMMHTPKSTHRNNKKKNMASPHWWKYHAIPSAAQIQPILRKCLGLHYDTATQRYSFPNSWGLPSHISMTITGLRKFLCCYGIPPNTTSGMTPAQQELLRRWLVFANVPTHNTSRLRNINSPKKTDQLLAQLYTLGFSTVDGKLFLPEYKRFSGYDGRPVHGQHYFHLDRNGELSTHVRVYIRAAWRLGVVTGDYFTDGTQQSAKYRDTLLPVRLWAAASSQPLPTWQSGRFDNSDDDDMLLLRPYTQMPDEEEALSSSEEESSAEEEEEEVSSDEEEEETVPKRAKEMSSPDSTSGASSSDEEEEESTMECADDDDDNPLWFRKTALPDFTKAIWPLLHKKLGFVFRTGAYGHPQVGGPIGNSKDLQAFCAEHGIPNYESAALTDTERRALFRWAAFAHVPVPPSHSVDTLRATPLLTDVQVRSLLQSQNFSFTANGTIVPPGGGPSFATWSDVRRHLRGAPELLRRRTPQLLALRLWAARCPDPLPVFQSSPEQHATTPDALLEHTSELFPDAATPEMSQEEEDVMEEPLASQDEETPQPVASKLLFPTSPFQNDDIPSSQDEAPLATQPGSHILQVEEADFVPVRRCVPPMTASVLETVVANDDDDDSMEEAEDDEEELWDDLHRPSVSHPPLATQYDPNEEEEAVDESVPDLDWPMVEEEEGPQHDNSTTLHAWTQPDGEDEYGDFGF